MKRDENMYNPWGDRLICGIPERYWEFLLLVRAGDPNALDALRPERYKWKYPIIDPPVERDWQNLTEADMDALLTYNLAPSSESGFDFIDDLESGFDFIDDLE